MLIFFLNKKKNLSYIRTLPHTYLMHCPQCMNLCIDAWKRRKGRKILPYGGGSGGGLIPISNKKNVTWWNGCLGLKKDRFRNHTNSGKSSLGLRVSFGSRVEFRSKNWNSYSFPIKWIWLSKIGDSISRFMGMGIEFSREIGPNWVRIPNST